MGYKLDFSEIDIDLQARIINSLELNIDSLEAFEGLAIDANYKDEEEEF